MTYYIGDTVSMECPGHNGDGHFHRHEATITQVKDDLVVLYSLHWTRNRGSGTRVYRVAQGRHGDNYLEEIPGRE